MYSAAFAALSLDPENRAKQDFLRAIPHTALAEHLAASGTGLELARVVKMRELALQRLRSRRNRQARGPKAAGPKATGLDAAGWASHARALAAPRGAEDGLEFFF